MRHRFCAGVTLALALSALLPPPPALADFGDITLVGAVTPPGAQRITDVWGYYDANTDRHFAVVGDWFTGVYVIDVTNPALPFVYPKITGVPGFDVKVYDHYVYTCDGNDSGGNDSRIVDIANVAAPVVLPNGFRSAHNIAISEGGTMFLEFTGVTAFDLSVDPTHPDSLWHIINQGHDATPRGDRLYDFNGGVLNIWDISNPAVIPPLIGNANDASVSYYHSGDESKDGNYLYVCDETATSPDSDIHVYDISTPSTPTIVGGVNDPTAGVHNLYVIGDLAFVSYYLSGFKVFDVTNPATPVLADAFDTNAASGEGSYNGAFGVYPFASTGLIYVTDHPNGLYIFSVEGHNPPSAAGDGPTAVRAHLSQNVPNPFNPVTTISFHLSRAGTVRLEVFDTRGHLVRTLADEHRGAGAHQVTWDGRDDRGQAMASGVYYYRLVAGASTETRKMVLLK